MHGTRTVCYQILIADKADKDVFKSTALCDYVSTIKRTASEKGLRSIGKTNPVAIIEHLSSDGTQATAAAKAKRSDTKRKSKTASGVVYSCFKFNTPEGCKGNCGFRHICLSCESHNHIAVDCPRRPGAVHSNHK